MLYEVITVDGAIVVTRYRYVVGDRQYIVSVHPARFAAAVDTHPLSAAFKANALGIFGSFHLPGVAVITSYSIHYTKLYDKDDLARKVNVNGSGISLGHPIAATGTMRLVTLVHEMRRRNARYGLETICGGGGQGICAIFESANK